MMRFHCAKITRVARPSFSSIVRNTCIKCEYHTFTIYRTRKTNNRNIQSNNAQLQVRSKTTFIDQSSMLPIKYDDLPEWQYNIVLKYQGTLYRKYRKLVKSQPTEESGYILDSLLSLVNDIENQANLKTSKILNNSQRMKNKKKNNLNNGNSSDILFFKRIDNPHNIESALSLVISSIFATLNMTHLTNSQQNVNNLDLENDIKNSLHFQKYKKLERILSQYTDIEYNLDAVELKNKVTGTIFQENFNNIIHSPLVQKSIGLLLNSLYENENENEHISQVDTFTIEDILAWVNSLISPTVTSSIYALRNCKHVDTSVIYDLLLRVPADEYEWIGMLEIYKRWGDKINIMDQERIQYMKQFQDDTKRYRERDMLIIPPVLNSFFTYALRNSPKHLVDIIDIYSTVADQSTIVQSSNEDINNTELKSNSRETTTTTVNEVAKFDTNILTEQISEMIWYLSIDITGDSSSPSRTCLPLVQTQLVKLINKLIKQDKTIEVSVTTLLGVACLTYFNNRNKGISLLNEAQKRFDKWQLDTFDIKGFERILKTQNTIRENYSMSEIRRDRLDINTKLLCTTLLILPQPGNISSQKNSYTTMDRIRQNIGNNKETSFRNSNNNNNYKNNLFNTLFPVIKSIDPEILKYYPEFWRFFISKLRFESNILNESMCIEIFEAYIQSSPSEIDPYVVDILLCGIDNSSVRFDLLKKARKRDLCMDQGNIATLLSKSYKSGSVYLRKHNEKHQSEEREDHEESDIIKEIKNSHEFKSNSNQYVKLNEYDFIQKLQSEKSINSIFSLLNSNYYTKHFDSPISLSRYIYSKLETRTPKIRSSYIFGESLVNPKGAFENYKKLSIDSDSNNNNINNKRNDSNTNFDSDTSLVDEKAIATLLTSVLRMKETMSKKEIENVNWGGLTAIDRCLVEFNKHTQQSYMDDITLIYPNINLWLIYVKLIGEFDLEDELFNLPQKWVDLRFNVPLTLMLVYLSYLPFNESIELLSYFNEYKRRKLDLQNRKLQLKSGILSEYDLMRIKKEHGPLPTVTSSKFKQFIRNAENNYDVIRYWNWPTEKAIKEMKQLNSKK